MSAKRFLHKYNTIVVRAATSNFWQARPLHWQPHHRCAAAAAAVVYSAKSLVLVVLSLLVALNVIPGQITDFF